MKSQIFNNLIALDDFALVTIYMEAPFALHGGNVTWILFPQCSALDHSATAQLLNILWITYYCCFLKQKNRRGRKEIASCNCSSAVAMGPKSVNYLCAYFFLNCLFTSKFLSNWLLMKNPVFLRKGFFLVIVICFSSLKILCDTCTLENLTNQYPLWNYIKSFNRVLERNRPYAYAPSDSWRPLKFYREFFSGCCHRLSIALWVKRKCAAEA